jgi:hypothetical protein
MVSIDDVVFFYNFCGRRAHYPTLKRVRAAIFEVFRRCRTINYDLSFCIFADIRGFLFVKPDFIGFSRITAEKFIDRNRFRTYYREKPIKFYLSTFSRIGDEYDQT